MKTRVHVAGTGVISAIGLSRNESLDSFRRQRTGIGHIDLLETKHKGVMQVGEIKLTNAQLSDKLEIKKYYTRATLLGIHAAREAVAHSGIDISRYRTGLISGTTVGGMDRMEEFLIDFFPDNSHGKLKDVINHECGKSTECIAKEIGLKGFISTVNTACSSSVNSIMTGVRMIQHGMMDVVIAGGTDCLTRFTMNGFNSLMILDGSACRPFDASRNGLNLGEGAGYVVLVSDKVLEQERLKLAAHVSGFANTNDAYHQTASSPEGRGSYDAMVQALELAGLNAADIDYINLHGTGTLNNDLSEGTAVKRLFGEQYPSMSSTKAFTGHTLGASGGIEAVFSIMAIEEGCLFPNLRFENAIPETAIIPQREFATGVEVKNVMSNSFGFGGNCSSIIFSRN